MAVSRLAWWLALAVLAQHCGLSSQSVWRTGISISSKTLDRLQGLVAKTCGAITGLTARQKTFCLQHSEMMDTISQGARLGQDECHRRFSSRKWDCPKNNSVMLKAALVKGYRESAYLQAIQSSGVVQAIARTCSSGKIGRHCGCDLTYRSYNDEQRNKVQQRSSRLNSNKEEEGSGDDTISWDLEDGAAPAVRLGKDDRWKWGGCGDNWQAGMRFAAEFLDSGAVSDLRTERSGGMFGKSPLVNRMALHNNKAGRLAVKRLLDIRCRCMGLSGSCSDKICWRVLPGIQRVGDRLGKRFHSAVKVQVDTSVPNGLLTIPSAPLESSRPAKRPPAKALVYGETAPSFCNYNQLKASPGTVGRECKPWSADEDSCQTMCCGRGYRTIEQTVEERCRCRFHWCCRVTCDTCSTRKQIHICN